MPAASQPTSAPRPPTPGAPVGDPAEHRRLPRKAAAKAWKVDLRELGRRAGSMTEWDKTLPAPAGWAWR